MILVLSSCLKEPSSPAPAFIQNFAVQFTERNA